MRIVVSLIIGLAATLANASDTMQIDGVPVFGKVHDVSPADIREALKAHGEEPAARIDVISKSEMHVYYRSQELGWIPSYHRQAAYGSSKLAWSDGLWLGIRDSPEALQFIRRANDVYIFPVRFTSLRSSVHNAGWLVPHRSDKHLRSLGPEARRELVRLLSRQDSWFQGFDDRISVGDEPPNVGFLFRKGGDELVMLFCSGGMMEGVFKGQHTGGTLEERPQQEMDRWKTKYAQRELAIK
jgi:hypothetical protein